jgi:hypothetical protein
MVPGPQSKSSRLLPARIRAAQELRSSEGTQVPDPRMVAEIGDGEAVIVFSTVIVRFRQR